MSALFQPFTLPRCLLQEPDCGFADEPVPCRQWPREHLGRFALGGAGLVFAEARGRHTHSDLGLWEDGQIEPFVPVVLEAEGAVPGIQFGHAGRKASQRR